VFVHSANSSRGGAHANQAAVSSAPTIAKSTMVVKVCLEGRDFSSDPRMD